MQEITDDDKARLLRNNRGGFTAASDAIVARMFDGLPEDIKAAYIAADKDEKTSKSTEEKDEKNAGSNQPEQSF